MNGVIGHSTYEFDLPGMNWGFSMGDPWGLWVAVAVSTLMIFGILFSALKGKYGFLLLVLILPGIGLILSVIGGIRLAKPRSYWARNFYDRYTMAEAIERHEPPINLENYPEPRLRNGYRSRKAL